MKYLLFIVLLVAVIVSAGCVNENKKTVGTPAPTPLPATILPTPRTHIPTPTTKIPTPLPEKSVAVRARQNGNDIIIEYLGGPGHRYVDDNTWEVSPGKQLYLSVEGMGTLPVRTYKGYDLSPGEQVTATVDGLGTPEKDHVVVVARYTVSPFFETILDTYV